MNSETVAVYHSHGAAEDAIRRLRKSAFDPKNITVVAEDYQCQERIVGYYKEMRKPVSGAGQEICRPMRRRVLQNTSWKGHPKESTWWNGEP